MKIDTSLIELSDELRIEHRVLYYFQWRVIWLEIHVSCGSRDIDPHFSKTKHDSTSIDQNCQNIGILHLTQYTRVVPQLEALIYIIHPSKFRVSTYIS